MADRHVVRNRRLVMDATGKSPVFFGPCMFHFKKDEETFRRFALEKWNPKLLGFEAVGVDMESALYQGFKSIFKDLSRFICVRHQQRDETKIEKLLERKNQTAQKKKSKYEILKDLYDEWSVTYYEYGRAESLDADNFQAKLVSLDRKWKTTVPGFHEWFLKHRKVLFEESVIQSVRVNSMWKVCIIKMT